MLKLKISTPQTFWYTRFIGTPSDAAHYFLGKIFNTGSSMNHLEKVTQVEMLTKEKTWKAVTPLPKRNFGPTP
jgi:hypothetical protein